MVFKCGPLRRPWWRTGALALAAAAAVACGDDGAAPPLNGGNPPRTFRMGFSGIPPKADLALAIAAIDMWSLRADAAIMSFELPWDSLLAGVPAETLVVRNDVPLAGYYRAKGHELWVYLDPANGLNRAGEAAALVDAGRSITEPEIQQLFRRYALAIDSLVTPEHLGLALETNLIRGIAPAPLYTAVRQLANDTAAELRARGTTAKLSVSVQVDWAWGRLGGGNVYRGVAVDFADFPFIDELGLSSYPYVAFAQPEEIPSDYYARLRGGRTVPLAVTEGGWTSATVDTFVSSEDEQRRYIARHEALLDAAGAIAVFQLTFTDLDLASIPSAPPGLALFAHLGLVDIDLDPKPALAAWDRIFARPHGP